MIIEFLVLNNRESRLHSRRGRGGGGDGCGKIRLMQKTLPDTVHIFGGPVTEILVFNLTGIIVCWVTDADGIL